MDIAIDDNLITEGGGGEGGQYGFFIHPGETVQLPFKYQSFGASEIGDAVNKKGPQSCDKIIKVQRLFIMYIYRI